ncbi:hypothetical protein niasHS_010251 [Heterodera schachtii]|uniref:Uncharacterized protein n=1 Tax=Heterodera schachtii TaxID=97005 RepID=A0ABD2J1D5_HETSC
MNPLKIVSKPSADAAEVTTQKTVNPNKPLRPAHWKRWYFINEETRVLVMSKARWWFFLIYPAWVFTHLEDYKPNPDRVRRAYFESQMGSPLSPLNRMKNVPGFMEANRQQTQ